MLYVADYVYIYIHMCVFNLGSTDRLVPTPHRYYQHANDYWNKKTGLQATGEVTYCLNAFYDLMA